MPELNYTFSASSITSPRFAGETRRKRFAVFDPRESNEPPSNGGEARFYARGHIEFRWQIFTARHAAEYLTATASRRGEARRVVETPVFRRRNAPNSPTMQLCKRRKIVYPQRGVSNVSAVSLPRRCEFICVRAAHRNRDTLRISTEKRKRRYMHSGKSGTAFL